MIASRESTTPRAAPEDPDDPDVPEIEVEETLPQGVSFAPGLGGEDGDGEWKTVVRFLPNGTASLDVVITFQAGTTRPLHLRLRALTGAVSVVWGKAEGESSMESRRHAECD